MARRLSWRVAATGAFYLAIGIFLFRYISQLDFTVLRATGVTWWLVVASIPASILARFLLVGGWSVLLHHYDRDAPGLPTINSIYATAWLARYIPGKVWYYVGKIRMLQRYGVSSEDAGLSSGLEAILQIGTALVSGLVLIWFSGELSLLGANATALAVGFSVLAAVALAPPIFNRSVRFLMKRLRSERFDERHYLKGGLLARLLLIYLAVQLLTGIPALLIMKAVYPAASWTDLPFITGVVVLSGALGALALFAPSGLGIREGLQLVMLSAVFPAEPVLVFVVLIRLFSVALDIGYWAISAPLRDRTVPDRAVAQ